MIVADTSVLVAAFASWHEQHDLADERLGPRVRLIAQCGFEFVATLTRLPAPFRVDAAPALDFLQRRSRGAWLVLDPAVARRVLERAVEAGVEGGALYDALIGLTARQHRATLLTLDRRAEPTYRAVDARYELIP